MRRGPLPRRCFLLARTSPENDRGVPQEASEFVRHKLNAQFYITNRLVLHHALDDLLRDAKPVKPDV